jgi:hypothetical protein
MDIPIQWLLEASPWVEYRTRVDLLNESEHNPEVMFARNRMLQHPLVSKLVADLANWPGQSVNSHKKADLPLHKLAFLADLGLNADDPGMQIIIERILAHQSKEGPFQVHMTIPVAYGGTGKEIEAWALCDSPTTLYCLIKFGLADHPQVQLAVKAQLEMVQENGYPCLGSSEMGTFRGPGRKEDPCPYATLIMLKALSALPNGWSFPATRKAAQSIVDLWKSRAVSHPYMFYMGTDFCKVKAPLNWYDLMHVCDILSQIPEIRSEPVFNEMVQIIASKLDTSGKVIPESIYQAWKDWDFGQKKEPSAWLTFLAHRILFRMGIATPIPQN